MLMWAWLATGPSAALAGKPGEAARVYILGAGDKLKVTIYGEPTLTNVYEIDGSGNISMPLIRSIPSAGKTTRELETLIAERLRPDYLVDPQVAVEVAEYRPFFILGEINKPGAYAYAPDMNGIRAVALAGGYTYRAREDYLQVIRADDPEQRQRRIAITAPIYPGDVVKVPERFF